MAEKMTTFYYRTFKDNEMEYLVKLVEEDLKKTDPNHRTFEQMIVLDRLRFGITKYDEYLMR